jgi:hypothetical protein
VVHEDHRRLVGLLAQHFKDLGFDLAISSGLSLCSLTDRSRTWRSPS